MVNIDARIKLISESYNKLSLYIDTIEKGIKSCAHSKFKKGGVIEYPAQGQLYVVADLHGNFKNLKRILHYSKVGKSKNRYLLLLGDFLHTPVYRLKGRVERSLDMVVKLAELKKRNPDSIHFLLGNHEVAQIVGLPKEKLIGSINYNVEFRNNLKKRFREDPRTKDLYLRVKDFLLSCGALVAHTQHGIVFSHTTPVDKIENAYAKFLAFQGDPLSLKYDAENPYHKILWNKQSSAKGSMDFVKEFKGKQLVTGHIYPGLYGEDKIKAKLNHYHRIFDSQQSNMGFMVINLDNKTYTDDDLVVRELDTSLGSNK